KSRHNIYRSLLQILLVAAATRLRCKRFCRRLLLIRCRSSKPPPKTGKIGRSRPAIRTPMQQRQRAAAAAAGGS
ncbi:MAG: hypothetical protein AB7T18_00260, partial [Alphaproteobacteria bacterium]